MAIHVYRTLIPRSWSQILNPVASPADATPRANQKGEWAKVSLYPMRLADSRDRAGVSAQTRPHHDGVRVVPVATHAAIYPTVCFSGRRTATDDRRFVDFLFGRVW